MEGKIIMASWLPLINTDKCTGCGECVVTCPTDVLRIVANKAALVAPQQCNYCAACEGICPTGAIELPYLICFKNDSKE